MVIGCAVEKRKRRDMLSSNDPFAIKADAKETALIAMSLYLSSAQFNRLDRLKCVSRTNADRQSQFHALQCHQAGYKLSNSN